MKVRIQKWGNSLALRIPKAFATETGIEAGAEVEVSLDDGKLVVQPAARPAFTLDGLLAGVTRKNRHAEITTGRAVGKEAWSAAKRASLISLYH
jgi:antitoxin MazE